MKLGTYANLSKREIFRAGTHNGDKYTVADLDAMVEAFNELDFSPALKLGHAQKESDAYGYVNNLRREGETLVADFENVDTDIQAKIDARKLSRVSAEVYWNFKRNGKTYPRVLGAVALLGHEIPGVAGLKPLHFNFGDDADRRCYEIDIATGEEIGGNAEAITQQKEAVMADLAEVQAELAALKLSYDARQEALKKYEAEQAQLATYKQESETLKAEVNRLRADAMKRTIAEKVGALNVPALRDHFAALYSMDVQGQQVKFYDAASQAESEKPVTDVLDAMVAHLNEKVAPMLKAYSEHTEAPTAAPVDNTVDAGREVDRLTREKMIKDRTDYSSALLAVLKEHVDLARVYTNQPQQ